MAEEAVVPVWREVTSGECVPGRLEVLEGQGVSLAPQRCT